MLNLRPIKFPEACDFIKRFHRHHKPPQGWLFGIGCELDGLLVAVAMVGRPVARHRDDGLTAEVTRLCTDGTPNAASKLYSACWRASREMGYSRIGTYILESERGTSLKAAGWRIMHKTPGRSWSVPSRQRSDSHPLGPKTLFEMANPAKGRR